MTGAAGDGDGGTGPDAPAPDRPPVLCDAMCGKLATYLRMCGYDAAYALDRGIEADDRLLSLAAAEDRTLITRDRELAARADDAIPLTERDVLDQLREVAAAGLPVELAESPTRCGACNGPVERVGPAGVDVDPDDRPEYVPDDVGASPAGDAADGATGGGPEATDEATDCDPDAGARPAWRCRDCGRWFWKGSHWASVADRLDGV